MLRMSNIFFFFFAQRVVSHIRSVDIDIKRSLTLCRILDFRVNFVFDSRAQQEKTENSDWGSFFHRVFVVGIALYYITFPT